MGRPVLEMGDVFVFVCVWLCEHVSVYESMCCLRCVLGCRRCVGCCVVMTAKMKSVTTEKIPRENLSPLQI